MKERHSGIEIGDPNLSKEAVRKNAESAHDWEWQAMAQTLYTWTDRFKSRFLDPVARIDRERMPDAVISFERMDVRVLACYTLHRNPQGLLDEITMNTKRLDRPMWAILETMLHEQIHLWQQNFGEHPVQRNYHNEEFVGRCEQLGLHPMIGIGAHWKPADGVFAQLMEEYGIGRPAEVVAPQEGRKNWWDIGKSEKGRSTLAKWSCGCQNVRVGTSEFHAQCTICGNLFVRAETPSFRDACDVEGNVSSRGGITWVAKPDTDVQ